MPSPDQQQRLAALRETIADIERKPALAEARARSVDGQKDAFPLFPGGLLQEIFTNTVRNGGASLGFALGQAKSLMTPKRMAVLYLQLAGDGQFSGLPYGPGLLSFGLNPARLVIVRTKDMRDLLWVAEESLACNAVAGIVADIGRDPESIDFTASRRLSLRAAESGASLFLLRYGENRQASAAHLRWHLMPHQSGRKRFDERAPGQPRWSIRLEKGNTGQRRVEWLLEWQDNGFKTLPDWTETGHRPHSGAPFPVPVPALLADRIPQTA